MKWGCTHTICRGCSTRQRELCQWFLQQTVATPDFPTTVLYTDEASLIREGIFLTHNSHVWDFENPHAQFVGRYQHRFSVNAWAGIVHNHLVGPYLFPNTLRDDNYLGFVRDVLPQLLENIPLNIRERIWFQHDGAPPHFDSRVRNNLHATFPNRWIDRSGAVPWPPRSSNLTSLDFFFWGRNQTSCV